MAKKIKKGWHVLYVRSCQEKKVHELLQSIQLESFLPTIKKIKKWSDRKKSIYQPLFPSYVFVKVNSPMEFHKALSVYGACAFIAFGNDYAIVRQEEIEMIKLLIGTGSDLRLGRPEDTPLVGEIRTIQQGPLQGKDCEIININNQNNIVVRIKSIQQNILVKIPIDHFYQLPRAV